MVRDTRVAYRPEKDSVVRPKLLQAVLGHHPPGGEVRLAAPVKLLPRHRKAKPSRSCLDGSHSFGNHFLPNTVSGNGCDPILPIVGFIHDLVAESSRRNSAA